MRLELRTTTREFTIDLPDHHYDLVVTAFQSHLIGEINDDELEYGIAAMMADHYDKEIEMNCQTSVISEDLPF
jgi:hypothetical protein